MRAFCAAVSAVRGGSGGRLMARLLWVWGSGRFAIYCHLLTLASLPSTCTVACLAPDLTQVSQISSGWIGASVRQTCAPFSFQTPDTESALSPAGVSVPDNCPPAASVMRAVKVLPPSRSDEETTSPLAS